MQTPTINAQEEYEKGIEESDKETQRDTSYCQGSGSHETGNENVLQTKRFENVSAVPEILGSL